METNVQYNVIQDASVDEQKTVTLSVTEAATTLGVSEPTIYRLIERRLLKILPGIRHKRITRRSFDTYCAGSAEN